MRQTAARDLMKGLYPDLLGSDETALLIKMGELSYDQTGDKDTVASMMEQYKELVGDATFSRQYRELGGASNVTESLSKLRDGSIKEYAVFDVLPALKRELKGMIVKKTVSAETK